MSIFNPDLFKNQHHANWLHTPEFLALTAPKMGQKFLLQISMTPNPWLKRAHSCVTTQNRLNTAHKPTSSDNNKCCKTEHTRTHKISEISSPHYACSPKPQKRYEEHNKKKHDRKECYINNPTKKRLKQSERGISSSAMSKLTSVSCVLPKHLLS